MDYMNDLHELCEIVSREIGEANEKIQSAGGKLTAGDVDYIDKLTHTLKSVKAVIAMMDDEGYSGDDGMAYRGRSYGDRMYRGRSYARRRDGMGRYSGRYSRDGNLVDQLHALMQDAPNEQIKREMQRLAEKVEQQM